jgi:2-methylisocitrate lyase-like PEP mutase family enzyme
MAEAGDQNAALRRLMKAGAGLIIPGAPNALTARIIEGAGFEAVYVTGAGVANAYLGAPDVGLTTATEVAEHVMAIRDAVRVPIVVDGDTGFGNAVNLGRTVRLFERAGASAIQIEDQVFPKRCGHFEGKEVVSRDEMVQKVKAAVDARLDPNMMIIARTDARAVTSFDDALERAAAYQEAGADVLFVEAPQTVEELRRIPQAVPGIHICNLVFGGKTPLFPREELAAMGFAAILYANAALQASMLAMKSVMAHLKSHGSLAGAEAQVISFKDRQELVDHARYMALEARYRTPSAQTEVKKGAAR